ncbi:hypothetical protein BgiBS90_029127, partial [Biomphalaria glabrata]
IEDARENSREPVSKYCQTIKGRITRMTGDKEEVIKLTQRILSKVIPAEPMASSILSLSDENLTRLRQFKNVASENLQRNK